MDTPDTPLPDENLAATLATEATGAIPVAVRRFTTGNHHYVFEALFADRAPVVVRIAVESERHVMAGAGRLSRLLRPQGVPLPCILADGLGHRHPHLILERLPGTDLGLIVRDLPDRSLETIATAVADAQRIAAGAVRPAGRYGYAVTPEAAPFECWTDVIDASLTRTRARTSAAGLFDLGAVEAVASRFAASRVGLDAVPPTPFLHDTTTKNVIVAPDGTLSGIVDVDSLCFGDPRLVAALTRASLMASGGPVSYVDALMRAAGWRDSRLFRLYVAMCLADFMSEHGQEFNGNPLPSSTADRQRLLDVFGECLQWADAADAV